MIVTEVELTNISPYENNPRLNENSVEKVQASIEAFGFKVPLVIDKDHTIVCGHTRYEAAKRLGLTSVPCVMADDLTEDQIKAYRLADNKVSEFSQWDFDKLEQELNEIDMSMVDFGFSGDSVTFTDEFEQVEPLQSSNDTADKTDEISTKVVIGEYQFHITKSEYLLLLEHVKLNYGFTKEEIMDGLKECLLTCN